MHALCSGANGFTNILAHTDKSKLDLFQKAYAGNGPLSSRQVTLQSCMHGMALHSVAPHACAGDWETVLPKLVFKVYRDGAEMMGGKLVIVFLVVMLINLGCCFCVRTYDTVRLQGWSAAGRQHTCSRNSLTSPP